ncbi:hypothetical protein VTN96DRAFT_3754 [Rasamsonia emersonii]
MRRHSSYWWLFPTTRELHRGSGEILFFVMARLRALDGSSHPRLRRGGGEAPRKSPNWPFQTAEHVPALAPAGTWLVWITFLLFLDRHLLIRSSRIDPAPRQLQEVGRFRGRRDASENGAPAGPCEELFPLYYEGARSRSRSRDASLKRLVWFGELAPGAPVKGVVPSLQSRGVQKSRGRPLSGLIFQPAGRMKCLGASQRACPL